MKILLLIFAVAGLCYGLQAPLHYKYKYSARISTGIPELCNQAAGWAMKAEVEVFVEKNDGIAVFKLSDVKTFEFENTNLGCDSRGGLPDDLFKSITDADLAKAIESPFRANLYDSKGFSIEFPEDKYRWLVNLRKGIVSIFTNAGIRGNVDKQASNEIDAKIHDGHIINVFTMEEETMFGKCNVQYAGHRIPDYLAGRLDLELRKQMEYDVQSSEPESSAYTAKESKTAKKYTSSSTKKTSSKKTSKTPEKYQRADVPELKNDLWKSTRTIDFDHCEEKVAFQVNSVDYTDVSGGQVHWRRGRSSVAELIFRGNSGSSRLERATVEGATTFAPFGFKTELLQARSNQTLQLVSVTSGGAVPVIPEPLQRSHTWMYEVWSFAEKPKFSKPHPWVVYTGEGDAIGRYQTFGVDYITDEEILLIKDKIIDKIRKVSLKLTDLDQEDEEELKRSPSKYLKKASYLFKFVSKEKALEIFDVFFEKNLHQSDILAKKLVIDAAAASGHNHAIDAIMEYIKDGKLPDLQIMTFFMTLASNAQCPGSIPKILDYVLTLDIKEKPFLTSTVAINLATLISEMCIHPQARNLNYAGKLFGDYGCQRQLIKERMHPYIMNLIKDEKEWVKIVGIKVFSALGVPSILPAIAPIIEGKVKCSSRLRIHAIYALEFWKLMEYGYLKEPIVDLLTDVYSDIGENIAVREAALLVVSTWSPNASFFHTLARISWREPSKRFASFISSLIKSVAEAIHPYTLKQSQAASHAVKFTKPVAPTPLSSQMLWVVTRDPNRHIINLFGGSVQISKSFSDIIEISSFMMHDFGGLEIVILEIKSILELGTLDNKIVAHFGNTEKAEGIKARIAKEFYENIEETLKSKIKKSNRKDSHDLYLLFLNHIQLFFPINEETISKLQISDPTSLGAFLFQLSMGYDLVLGKYFNPIDFTSIHPTELGLPLTITGSTPTVITDVSYSSFATGSKTPGIEALKKSELSVESLISISSQFRSSIGVLLPWDQKLVKSGVVSSRDITLPFKKTLRGNEGHDGGHQTIVHFDIQSIYKNKFSVIKASNTPYTGIFSLLPIYGKKPAMSIISKSEPKETKISVPSKYTGLDLQLTLKSEASLPFTFWTPDELLSLSDNDGSPWLFYAYASPTVKYWYANLEFDPLKSATKNISFEFMTGTFGKSEQESLTQKTGDFYQYGQEGQEGFEQYDQEQQSFKPHPGFQEFGGNQEVETLGHVNYGDSIEQRSQKMQEHFGGKVEINSFKVNFEGEQRRSYEMLISSTKSKISESRKIKKFQVSFVRSPIPYVDSKPASVCIDVQKSVPKMSKLHNLESLLKEDLDKEIKAEITLGCTGEPVFVAKGSLHISDAWKTNYLNHVFEICTFDPNDPVYTFNQHAVYDELKFTYTWEKVCDPVHFPIMTRVFKIGRHIIDSNILSDKCGEETERKIQVNIHKCPVSTNWFIDILRDNIKVSYENIPNSNEFNYIFGVHRNDIEFDFYPDHYSTFNLESDKCIVGEDKVRTFDGLTFSYNPSNCWTVAAKSCLSNDKMLLVRASQDESNIPEAQYIDVSKGLVIEYIKHSLIVNGKYFEPSIDGEKLKSDDGKFLAKIYKKSGYGYLVKFSGDSYIVFQDKIEVHVDFMSWGEITTCGLCGNHDGEPENDLVGPQRCFYSDPNLFAASWAAKSDKCDLYTLLELREAAEKYQSSDSCKSIDALYDNCPYFNHRCISSAYKVISEEGNICISSSTLPWCEASCDIQEYETKQFTFNCWPADYAPDVLKTAAATNQESINEPLSHEPYFTTQKYISIPSICKQF